MAGVPEVGMSPRYSTRVSHLPDRSAVCVVVVAAVWGTGGGELSSLSLSLYLSTGTGEARQALPLRARTRTRIFPTGGSAIHSACWGPPHCEHKVMT